MISRNVTIRNSVGLHARPATYFIQKVNFLLSVKNNSLKLSCLLIITFLSLINRFCIRLKAM